MPGSRCFPARRVFWKVRVWDRYDRQSAWSDAAHWSVGLLRREDWKGRWIGLDAKPQDRIGPSLPARMLRREFTLPAPAKRAMLYASGLGLSELYLNGRKVGDHVLSPGLTEYPKRVFYVAFDVTTLVQPGQNCIGAWLGSGRYCSPRPTISTSYGFPKLLLQLSRRTRRWPCHGIDPATKPGK